MIWIIIPVQMTSNMSLSLSWALGTLVQLLDEHHIQNPPPSKYIKTCTCVHFHSCSFFCFQPDHLHSAKQALIFWDFINIQTSFTWLPHFINYQALLIISYSSNFTITIASSLNYGYSLEQRGLQNKRVSKWYPCSQSLCLCWKPNYSND